MGYFIYYTYYSRDQLWCILYPSVLNGQINWISCCLTQARLLLPMPRRDSLSCVAESLIRSTPVISGARSNGLINYYNWRPLKWISRAQLEPCNTIVYRVMPTAILWRDASDVKQPNLAARWSPLGGACVLLLILHVICSDLENIVTPNLNRIATEW